MKLQHLAVIFIIIILPIAMVLSTYTDGLIKVINNQTHYDEVLSNATYDAIRAYQMNTLHNSFASVNNSRERDINASVNSFFNSLSLGLNRTGNSKEELNEYIPAMLFTLYDGYYVYGPMKNNAGIGTPNALGNAGGIRRAQYSTEDNGKLEYGLMPYTYYSCEYEGTAGGNKYDIIINYSLDNYISVSGTYGTEEGSANPKYFTAAGYYIDADKVTINNDKTVTIDRNNGNVVTIRPETLGEYISFTDEIKVIDVNGTSTRVVKQAVNETPIYYNYINYNETKYYLETDIENLSENNNTSYSGIPIFYIDNDVRVFINRNMLNELAKYTGIENPDDLYNNKNNFKDTNAYHYYKDAKAFSESVYPYLKDIDVRESDGKYGNVKSEFFNKKYDIYPNNGEEDVNSAHIKVSYSELDVAHPFDYKENGINNNPEEEISIFNNHRIDVIVSSIEASLTNSIGNFNNYVSNTFSYAMPTLSENDWYKIANNVTTVSFMQGLPIGRTKFYSNYSVIANKKTKEFISRDSIYVQDDVNVMNLSKEQLNDNYINRSAPEYHSPSCEDYNSSEYDRATRGVIGYRSIDYEEEPVLNTYPELQEGSKILASDGNGKRIEKTQSINYYFQPGTGAYECIVSRNENRITTDDLISQKSVATIRKDDGTEENLNISQNVQTAYISALAREKGASYKNHSGLNYHRYMQVAGGELGENPDKTYNSIDKNFSDESNLKVPTVSDPDYNGENTPVNPFRPDREFFFNNSFLTMKIGEQRQIPFGLPAGITITEVEGKVTGISDENIVTNNVNGIVGGLVLEAKSLGSAQVYLQVTYKGAVYTAICYVGVVEEAPEGPPELDEQTIRIYKAENNQDITNEEVTMLTNERMDIYATKTDTRDTLFAVSSDSNKVKVQRWNSNQEPRDTGMVQGKFKTENPVQVTVHGSIPFRGTTNVASANFNCSVIDQNIMAESIVIGVGDTKRVGLDDEADYKIRALNEEFIYEIYKIRSEDDNFASVDENTGNLTGLKEGKAILHITGRRSGATADILVTVVDVRPMYYATLHTNGTLGIALTEERSKISGLNPEKTYVVTLANEKKFITSKDENDRVREVRFIERITIGSKSIDWFKNWPNIERMQNEDYVNTENITNMSEMFFKCAKLTGNLNLSTWNTSKVQYMDHMFDACNSIEGLNISTWDTSEVRKVEYMFYNCLKLKSIDANRSGNIWNLHYITNTEYMFSDCSSLERASLNNWNPENVTNMQYMFNNCSSLKSLSINSWNTSRVTTMRFMFSNCNNLLSLDMDCNGDEWNVSKVTEFERMFEQCSSITHISVRNWDIRNARTIEYMFTKCSSLPSLDLHTWKTSSAIPKMHNVFEDDVSLKELNLTGWIFGPDVTSMFNNCRSLTTEGFKIAQVDTSHVLDMNNIFAKCQSLESIELNTSGVYWDVSNVTEMRDMFNECTGLKTVRLENWDVRKVKSMYAMFASCQSLDNIDLSSWKTGNITTNMKNMFSSCYSLTTMNLTGLIKPGVIEINQMFANCKSLTTFSWDSWEWNFATVRDMNGMFMASGLVEIYLDLEKVQGAPSLITIEHLLIDCKDLEKVTMINWIVPQLENMDDIFSSGGSVANGKVSISYGTKLKELNMSNWNISNLKDVVSPSGIKATPIEQINKIGSLRTSLETVVMNDWVLSDNIDGDLLIFQFSEKLKYVSMSNWYTGRIREMKDMFRECKKLEKVIMNKWQAASVTDLSYLFAGKVTSMSEPPEGSDQIPEPIGYVEMLDWVIDNHVTSLHGLFEDCYGLSGVKINNWVANNLYTIDSMFKGCGALTDIEIENWQANSLYNMYNMFYDCDKLETIKIKNWELNGLSSISYWLGYRLKKLEEVELTNWTVNGLRSMAYMFDNSEKYLEKLEKVSLINWKANSLNDMEYLFNECNTLKYATINAWNANNLSSMSYMFNKCGRIERPTISNMVTPNLSDMSYMFNECYNLSTLDEIKNIDTSNLTNMSHMFYQCRRIDAPNLTMFKTAKVNDMTSMFEGCSKLSYIDVSSWNTRSLTEFTSIYGMFVDTNLGDKYAQEFYNNLKNFKVSNLDNNIFYKAYDPLQYYNLTDDYRDCIRHLVYGHTARDKAHIMVDNRWVEYYKWDRVIGFTEQ